MATIWVIILSSIAGFIIGGILMNKIFRGDVAMFKRNWLFSANQVISLVDENKLLKHINTRVMVEIQEMKAESFIYQKQIESIKARQVWLSDQEAKGMLADQVRLGDENARLTAKIIELQNQPA